MFTSSSCIRMPGRLQANDRLMPSSGWMRMTSRLALACAGVQVVLAADLAEEPQRRLLELHRDLGDALRQPLAGAQEERHAGPAPVVDRELQRDVGLGDRLRVDAFLLAVAVHHLAVALADAVLAAHRVRPRPPRAVIGTSARSTFTFSSRIDCASSDDGGSIATRQSSCSMWFCTMSRSAPACVVVGAAAALHAERLGDGDLHVVDVLLVQQRLEDRVGEAEAQDVLDGLFAEVVIDAVDLALVEDVA